MGKAGDIRRIRDVREVREYRTISATKDIGGMQGYCRRKSEVQSKGRGPTQQK